MYTDLNNSDVNQSVLFGSGFKVRRFEECLAFVYRCESDANMVSDKSLMMHLYSSIALW